MAHTHYTGTGKMHSFRGLLEDDVQRKVSIQGATGEIAWRITKFQIMPGNFNVADEYNVSIYREEQDSLTTTFNFTEDELLAAAYLENSASTGDFVSPTVIFDNALFSRNIYISLKSQSGNNCNYYIELEEVKVSAAGMAQLAVAAARRVVITD